MFSDNQDGNKVIQQRLTQKQLISRSPVSSIAGNLPGILARWTRLILLVPCYMTCEMTCGDSNDGRPIYLVPYANVPANLTWQHGGKLPSTDNLLAGSGGRSRGIQTHIVSPLEQGTKLVRATLIMFREFNTLELTFCVKFKIML